MHININTPGYSIAQQETVGGRIRKVNQVNNVGQGYQQNPEERSTRRSNQNVEIVNKRTLKITFFGRILQAVHHDGRTNAIQINKPQDQVIGTSNESTNTKD